MKPFFMASIGAAAFFAGAFCLLLSTTPTVRMLGALVLGLVLPSMLLTYIYSGQIQVNDRLVAQKQQPFAYWMNIGICGLFAVAFAVVLILVATGYVPVNAPAR